MPRIVESPGTKVLNFFGGAPLAVAVLVLGLATDIVRARKAVTPTAKVQVAKAVLKKAKKAVRKSAPAPVATPKRRKRASRAKAKPAGATETSTVEDLD